MTQLTFGKQASGNLGPSVLKELLDAGFDVTILGRSNSTAKHDPRAKVVEVDYSSFESLKAALGGHQAVVNTLGAAPQDIHLRLIDAAVAAKVQRFVPSEFGNDTTNPKSSKLPVYADKVAIQHRLKEIVQKNGTGFSYTLLFTGAFLDWGLKTKFLLNLSGPSTEIHDGGDAKFSVTTLSGVGKAISGILAHLDATANQAVFVREADVTQNQLLKLSGKDLKKINVSTIELERNSYDELGKSNPDHVVWIVGFIKTSLFGKGYGGSFSPERLSNDLLQVKTLSEEELKQLVLQCI
jgi:hypothetical protein